MCFVAVLPGCGVDICATGTTFGFPSLVLVAAGPHTCSHPPTFPPPSLPTAVFIRLHLSNLFSPPFLYFLKPRSSPRSAHTSTYFSLFPVYPMDTSKLSPSTLRDIADNTATDGTQPSHNIGNDERANGHPFPSLPSPTSCPSNDLHTDYPGRCKHKCGALLNNVPSPD